MIKDPENKLVYFAISGSWGLPYTYSWTQAQEVDIGVPTGDYYVYASGLNPAGLTYEIWARDFTKGFVLFRAKDHWSYDVYDDSTAVTVTLPEIMTPINSDGTLLNPSNTFDIRSSEALILSKAPPLSCSEYSGTYCSSGQECLNGNYVYSTEGPLCCVDGGTCFTDSVAPSDITDLSTTSSSHSTAVLQWTAVGDDGNSGTAEEYDIRYSTSPITELNWDSATQATGEPSPQASGTIETFTVTNLLPETIYYFAIKARDNAFNYNGISNIATTTTSSFYLKLDFEFSGATTSSGFTSYTPSLYSSAIGYGWQDLTGMETRDRGLGDVLWTDLHHPSGQEQNSFLIDVSPGLYRVTLYSDDTSTDKAYDLYAEGQFIQNIAMDADFAPLTFETQVDDGQLTLEFITTIPGHTFGVINGLEVEQLSQSNSNDINSDGNINIIDLAIVIFNQGQDASNPDYSHLDLDEDGDIDWDDVKIILNVL